MALKKDSTYPSSSVDLEKLAQRLKRGEADAIELIYRGYFRRLLYYGIQIMGPDRRQEVEDVVQEFFIWLAENNARAAEVDNLESYMFRAVRRNLKSRLNVEKKSQATHDRYISRTLPLQESSSHSPEQLHIQREESESIKVLIQRELDQLPPYLREALYLRYFENKSYPEVAAILSVSDQAAYNYVFRAIKRLKKQLSGFKKLMGMLYGIVKILFC